VNYTICLNSGLHSGPEAVHGVPGSKLVPQVFGITVIRSHTTGATLFVRNNHAILHRVKVVLFTQHGKQFHSGVVCSGCGGSCGGQIGTGEGCAACIFDISRFTHFNPNVGVVCGSPGVPSTAVPRKGLVNIPGVGINEAMDTSPIMSPNVLRVRVQNLYEDCGRWFVMMRAT